MHCMCVFVPFGIVLIFYTQIDYKNRLINFSEKYRFRIIYFIKLPFKEIPNILSIMNWENIERLTMFKDDWATQHTKLSRNLKAELLDYIEVLTKHLKESWFEYERLNKAYEEEYKYRKELQKRLYG